MNLKNYQITVGEVLQNPQAKAMLQKERLLVMRHRCCRGKCPFL